MKFYLYRHIRLDKNVPFYIGIGSKPIDYSYWCQEFNRGFNRSQRNKLWKGLVSRTDYDVEILMESEDYEFIKEKEKEFIALYGRIINGTGTLCNLTEGGEGILGLTHSEEAKYKMSIGHLGRPAWNKGIPVTKDQKELLLSLTLGRKHSEEQKINSRIREKGKHSDLHLLGNKALRKKVYKYSLNGVLLETYDSAINASKALGLNKGAVSDYILNNNTTKGFIWSYKKL